ncbi:hypothetical protein BH23CHL4_BH23CHL4_26300 [soil metagenome]
MIVVRSIMQAKFGYGGHLAAAATEGMEAFTKAFKDSPRWRILTELSGPFDTVTIETDVVSLAEWEAARAKMFALPEFEETLNAMQELVVSGRLEYLNVESQG